ncbi:uncharacterized protein LOC111270267 isoform X4 [Varroa jacobsoni]|uniref:uncharacterized protein LOC111270267 isoform X4 n=1 Tax=Varroa jacobsoni TaxID=62625 RepID=UPI000BF83BF2|nr:uncharacterized protein LOC111270267 isoform X4 [Varroa jacobsoni]
MPTCLGNDLRNYWRKPSSCATMCRFNVLCFTAVAILSGVSFAEKVILMEDYDPEKVQGTWYVWRINAMIFDEVKCIKFDMLHDIGTEDLYRINSKWINTEGQYKHTEFNVLDDKYHKAQYLFESTVAQFDDQPASSSRNFSGTVVYLCKWTLCCKQFRRKDKMAKPTNHSKTTRGAP